MTQQRPSPNHSSRRGAKIRWIVLHADASPSERATLDWICSPRSAVSYHLFVHRDGTVTRCVPDDRAAWACGVSAWDGVQGLNRHSISIAFANRHDGKERLSDAQIDAMMRLVQSCKALHPTVEDVLTHAMIAPGRKSDPDYIPNFYRHDYG
jgi:N-acetylmuramoyl-L-alanine amidase